MFYLRVEMHFSVLEMTMAEEVSDDLVSIGVIGRSYGLKGDMRVRLFERSSKILDGAHSISLKQSGILRPYSVFRTRWHGEELLLSLVGRADRESAERLRGAEILVQRTALPAPDEDEFYDIDLIGLAVSSVEKEALGRVVAVEHPPANDVLVVELEQKAGYLDIPMIDGVVMNVDLEGRAMVIDLPEGLPTRKRR
jgi:16S rRNA processing protein RimM